MTEYIIRWDGIARQLMELRNNGVPLQLWSKRIRAERLREPIVHCKDCALRVPGHVEISIKGNMIRVPDTCKLIRGYIKQIEPDGFCAWGERKVVDNAEPMD